MVYNWTVNVVGGAFAGGVTMSPATGALTPWFAQTFTLIWRRPTASRQHRRYFPFLGQVNSVTRKRRSGVTVVTRPYGLDGPDVHKLLARTGLLLVDTHSLTNRNCDLRRVRQIRHFAKGTNAAVDASVVCVLA